jgi:hypothetical protein
MNDATTRFLLQVFAVLLGGGSVQLIIRLAFKKSDLRKTNTESDSVVVTAANNQVLRLEVELKRAFDEVDKLRANLDSEISKRTADMAEMQRAHIKALADAQENSNAVIEEFRKENVKLNRLLTRCGLDLSHANAEISILKGGK